jgi:hypothetical protein
MLFEGVAQMLKTHMSKLMGKVEGLRDFAQSLGDDAKVMAKFLRSVLVDVRALEAERDELKLENGRLGKQLARVPRVIEAAKREAYKQCRKECKK